MEGWVMKALVERVHSGWVGVGGGMPWLGGVCPKSVTVNLIVIKFSTLQLL